MGYRYFTAHPAYAPNGDLIVAELPLEQVRWGRTISGYGSVQARLNARHVTATMENLRAGYHQLIVERDGQVKWCGPIWTVQTALQANDPYLTIGANEWFSWFVSNGDLGRNTGDTPVEWETMDQVDVAQDCIRLAQIALAGENPNANQGIEAGEGELSGVVREETTHYWYEFVSYGDIVTAMAEKDDGFDFLIESSWDDAVAPLMKVKKVFNTWAPKKLGHATMGIDAGMPVSAATATWDATRSGNHVTAVGAGSADGTLAYVTEVYNDYWRRDLTRKWVDIEDLGVLAMQAAAAAKRYGQPVALPTISVANTRTGGSDLLRDFELGQTMNVNIDQGYFSLHDELRVVAYDVTVNGDQEDIAFTFNFLEDLFIS